MTMFDCPVKKDLDNFASEVRSAQKYGKRNVAKMIRQVEKLRQAIRAEGTPAIQDAWDKVEEHIDYAYRGQE